MVTSVSAIEKIGVIGAGVMGCGVAHVAAQAGLKVVLIDKCGADLERAAQTLRHNLRQDKFFNPNAPDTAETLARIDLTLDYGALKDAQFVVENITEDWDAKKTVYSELDRSAPAGCVFAANTSTISITQIGGATGRPDRIIGMHFMNPVPMKPTVEVIRGYHTSDETLGIANRFLEAIGRGSVVVNDAPGFVSNRVLMLTINEAAFLVHEGTASAPDVDRIFRECFAHKMGPLELADLIGLDTILLSIEGLYKAYSDSKYRPSPLLQKMVQAGLYGRKSGQGFYRYD